MKLTHLLAVSASALALTIAMPQTSPQGDLSVDNPAFAQGNGKGGPPAHAGNPGRGGPPAHAGKPGRGGPPVDMNRGPADRGVDVDPDVDTDVETRLGSDHSVRFDVFDNDDIFDDDERDLIREFFANEDYDRSALPPGLAKRESLPPGLQRHVETTGALPPGLQKRVGDLEGREVLVRDRDIILVDEETGAILDVIEDVIDLANGES